MPPINNFAFTPADGLRNKVEFATTPANEDDARAQLQTPLDQIRDYNNNTLLPGIESNRTGLQSQVDAINAELGDQSTITVTANLGTSVVNATRVGKWTPKGIEGRTLVNHTGREGGFHKQGSWDANLTIDNANYKFGTSSGKIDNSAGTTEKTVSNTQKMYLSGKRVLVGVWAKAVSGTPTIRVYAVGADSVGAATDITKYFDRTIDSTWKFYYQKFDLTASTDDHWMGQLNVETFGTADDVVNFDGLVMYELTSSEYSYAHTQAEIEAQFPYVDDLKSISRPYVIHEGKNLAGTGSSWTIGSSTSTFTTDAVAGQAYTLSKAGVSTTTIAFLDANNAALTAELTGTQTAPAGTKRVRITTNLITIENIDAEKIMLNLGSTALAFEPQNRTYHFIETDIRASVNGSVKDELYYDDLGLPRVVRRHGFTLLDGTFSWLLSVDYAGFKVVTLKNDFTDSVSGNASHTVVKYDGTILGLSGIESKADVSALDPVWSNNFSVSIADTDSGWGDAYNAVTSDEIKAYFNGWKADAVDAGGKPTSWVSLVDGTQPPTDTLAYVSANKAPGLKPYQLQYQLAASVDEAAKSEGTITLHEGSNQLTMGAGVIVREAANPQTDAPNGNYYINRNASPTTGSNLKNRVDKILEIYKNDSEDNAWILDGSVAYGNQRAYIAPANYDTTAAYSVTYLALDLHTLGFAPQSIAGTYQGNLAKVVDQHTEQLADVETRLDVVDSTFKNVALNGLGEVVQHGNATATGTITFKRAYASPPQIILGAKGTTLPYATNVTTTGFTLNGAAAYWVAIGK